MIQTGIEFYEEVGNARQGNVKKEKSSPLTRQWYHRFYAPVLPGNLDSLNPLPIIYQCRVLHPNEKILGWNTANHSNYSRCREVTHLLYFVTPALGLIQVIGRNAS